MRAIFVRAQTVVSPYTVIPIEPAGVISGGAGSTDSQELRFFSIVIHLTLFLHDVAYQDANVSH